MSPTSLRQRIPRRDDSPRPRQLAGPVAAWGAVALVAAVVGVSVGVNLTVGVAVAFVVFAFGVFVADPIVVVGRGGARVRF